jgi:hypothetical protein
MLWRVSMPWKVYVGKNWDYVDCGGSIRCHASREERTLCGQRKERGTRTRKTFSYAKSRPPARLIG